MSPAATLRKSVLLVFALAVFAVTAKANELWVAPASLADKLIADFAVAQKKTHFGFGVPDNFTGFTKATVLLIGRKDQDISYDLTLSISQNLGSARAFVTEIRDIPASVLKGQLLELDVSAIFGGAPALQAGTDYVSLSSTSITPARNIPVSARASMRTGGTRTTPGTRVPHAPWCSDCVFSTRAQRVRRDRRDRRVHKDRRALSGQRAPKASCRP